MISVFLNHVIYLTTESGSNRMVWKFFTDHSVGKKCDILIYDEMCTGGEGL